MRNRSLLGGVAAVAVLSSAGANACPIAPSDNILSDTESSRESADVVALVTVASSAQTEQGARTVELIIERTWKGRVGARWTFTQSLATTCDYPLQSNVRYVIFAKRQDDGKVSVRSVADGALSVVKDRLSAKVKPVPSLKTASSSAVAPARKKKR